ncbi:MAG: hypothetical protein H7238_03455 [Polaromonas sp.]|nr:hypothetical protein [Polaromonas sp.]
MTAAESPSAALIDIAIAALGVGLSHALNNPYRDPAVSVLIGLALIASAGLLAQKRVSLLVSAGLDRDQVGQLRKIIVADPAVESVGHLLTMGLDAGECAVDGCLAVSVSPESRRGRASDQTPGARDQEALPGHPAPLRGVGSTQAGN